MGHQLQYSQSGIAYLSMEIAFDSTIPTYSGGLGVLAGDILRSAADLEVPMVGVTLLHRQGYFRQQLAADGTQTELAEQWSPEDRLERLETTVTIEIEGRKVRIRPWRFMLTGIEDYQVPVLLLDTALESNSEFDRSLTDRLYGGDAYYRLCQEAVLGLGGVAVLRALGYDRNLVYHMNEGHSALLTLALLEETLDEQNSAEIDDETIEAVCRHCVFTTHTPVAAGHDQFPVDLVSQVLGPQRTSLLQDCRCLLDSTLNMTYLALRFSRYVNGVSMRHGEVSLDMFPGYPIHAITNGVHAVTWTSSAFSELFDRVIPGWRHDNRYLRYAIQIPLEDIQAAHQRAKLALLDEVERRTGIRLAQDVIALGFARRATPYKRADLLLTDVERLNAIAERAGPLQLLYAGKAHPRDEPGKEVIRRIHEAARGFGERVRLVYLENYDLELAKYLCSGVDLWLNTPRRPQEASGTSGMKAACNGVPSFSVLDGWWVEGHVEGVTGWSLLDQPVLPSDESLEVDGMYDKLEKLILPLYYSLPRAWAKVMRSAIALNASFFNTQRVVSQYVRNAYSGNGGL
jgi:starch phosphorylase